VAFDPAPTYWPALAELADQTTDRSTWLWYLGLGRHTPCVDALVDAYEPKGAHGHVMKAFAWLAQGRPEGALAEADAAQRCEAVTLEAHLARAHALGGLGRLEEAEKAASAYVDAASWNPEALKLRASIRHDLGEETLAADDRRQLARLLVVADRNPGDDVPWDRFPMALCDALAIDMSYSSTGTWGRWCSEAYRGIASRLVRDVLCMSHPLLREKVDIPDFLAGYYGVGFAAQTMLTVNLAADPDDPRESILNRGEFGEGLLAYPILLRHEAPNFLPTMLKKAANPQARLAAANTLAEIHGLKPEDLQVIEPTTREGYLALEKAWRALNNVQRAREAGAIARDKGRWPEELIGRAGYRVKCIATMLRRLQRRYAWGMEWLWAPPRPPLADRVLQTAVVLVNETEAPPNAPGQPPVRLTPTGAVTIPPALEEAPQPNPPSHAASGLVDAELARQTYLDLQTRPMSELRSVVAWCKLAIIRDVAGEDGAAGLFELRLIAYHCPTEVIAYQVVWAKHELDRHPGATPGGSLGVEIASSLAQPESAGLLAQARAYAPELFTEQMEGWIERARKDAEEARQELGPDYVDVLWGDPETSLAAARRLAEQGDELGELVVWFWTTYPAGGHSEGT